MYRIDNSSAVTAIPTPAAPGPNPNGFFSGGNPATLTPATIVDEDWLNSVQEEICNVIGAANITLSKVVRTQLLAAIRALIATNGFNPGFGDLTTSQTLSNTSAGKFFSLSAANLTITLNSASFSAGQVVGFTTNYAGTACTIAANTGGFYGGNISGLPATIKAPSGSFVILQWDGVNWRAIAFSGVFDGGWQRTVGGADTYGNRSGTVIDPGGNIRQTVIGTINLTGKTSPFAQVFTLPTPFPTRCTRCYATFSGPGPLSPFDGSVSCIVTAVDQITVGVNWTNINSSATILNFVVYAEGF